MSRKEEEQMAAMFAKAMAMICVRNTMLEGLHAGRVPVTKTGDFSDVFVVDADGQHMPEYVPVMAERMEADGADIVFMSRFSGG